MKKLLSLLCALALCLGMLPATALAAEGGTPTTLMVGGTTVINHGIVQTVSGSGWSYADGVLTLNNANLSGSWMDFDHYGSGIYALGDLTINMVGSSRVTGSDMESDTPSAAIYIQDGVLTLTGSGILSVTGGAVDSIQYSIDSHGILVESHTSGSQIGLNMTGGTLIADGGTCTENDSYGVCVSTDAANSTAEVNITNGSLTARGGSAGFDSVGLHVDSEGEGESNRASLTVGAGGTVAAQGGSSGIDMSAGFDVNGGYGTAALTVEKGGTLTASSGGTNGVFCSDYGGIVSAYYGKTNVVVRGSLICTSMDVPGVAGYTCGFLASSSKEASLTVDGGTLTAISGNAPEMRSNSYGLDLTSYDSNANLSVTNGTLTAISGSAAVESMGTYLSAENGSTSATLSGGTLVTNSMLTAPTGNGSWMIYGMVGQSVKGSVTLSQNITIPTGAKVTIPAGASLTVPKDVTLTNNGTIDITGGTLAVQGKLVDNGVVNGTVTQVPVEQPSSWAAEQVNAAIAAGIVPASLQSKYTQTATRAEFCALAVAMYETVTGSEITDRLTFADTSDPNVEKMAALGVVNGTGGNNFSPNDPLNREQAATILARLSGALGKPISASAPTFNDNASISSWAFDSVGQVQAAKIMEGTGGNNFSPAVGYSREQCIITMMRLYDQVK